MTIIHTVLLSFKPDADPKVVSDTWERLVALKDNCVHAKTGKKYVKSHGAGRDISIESFQFGLTHGMTLEFESEADRDFYVKEDPAHLDVVARLKDIIADVRVIDFTPGTF